MKLEIDRAQLQAAFAKAAAVAPKRTAKPILANVRLDAASGEIILTATDLEFGIRIACDADVKEAGAAILPTQRFAKLLAEDRSDRVRLQLQKTNLIVRADRSEYKLPTENVDEFPTLAAVNPAAYYTIDAAALRLAIGRTAFCIDEDSARYALGGCLFEIDDAGQVLHVVATDGRRMAVQRSTIAAVGSPARPGGTVVVQARALKLIRQTIADDAGQVRFHVSPSGNEIVLQADRATFTSRLVEGRFPRWRDVMPSRSSPLRIEQTAAAFLSPLRQVSVVNSDDAKKVDFDFVADQLTMTSRNPQLGESTVVVPIVYSGAPTGIALDHVFAADWLKTLDGEERFTLDVADAEHAALFESGESKYIVMPLSRN